MDSNRRDRLHKLFSTLSRGDPSALVPRRDLITLINESSWSTSRTDSFLGSLGGLETFTQEQFVSVVDNGLPDTPDEFQAAVGNLLLAARWLRKGEQTLSLSPLSLIHISEPTRPY
eukprot:TRINITY_DN27791_c0_g1_i1.p1 TRINITY_DN27791_c0_g1~~TRINITY_DN27791_c0_g1_i1.p1  ORF type:complete len:116 (+),score=32.28 TRINITY_DN27791_c0_g1_i1:71-418(+)